MTMRLKLTSLVLLLLAIFTGVPGETAETPRRFLFVAITTAAKSASVSSEGKIEWEFPDHANFKTINQVQMLDISGDVTKGEILR